MAANIDSNMTDEENKKKFEALVELISELQAKGTNPEIHKETREDLKFDVDQEKLQIQREEAAKSKASKVTPCIWRYKIIHLDAEGELKREELHGPFMSQQMVQWKKLGYFNETKERYCEFQRGYQDGRKEADQSWTKLQDTQIEQ